MRIVASLGVKDEAELIERTIAHLRSIGVDLIVACDMESTDGTADILRAHASADGLWLVQMSDQESQEDWVRTNLDLVKQADADWAIFLDADEYPIPATGRLKDCAALAEADAVRIDRFNVPLGPDGPMFPDLLVPDRYEELLLIVDSTDSWNHLEKNPAAPWIRKTLAPRVMARADRIGGLTAGAHDVTPFDSRPLRRAHARDLVVAHLPFSSRARFARKAANVRRLLATHDDFFGPQAARHWRRWSTAVDEGTLDEEFDRQVFWTEELRRLRQEGVIRSAAQLFRERSTAR